ncbi:hypothetical protein EIP91_008482 [Steccherinum ochraceum]|uniref:Uncharacterized protein n=1 Tax=Steccherinum ochraceum TaxID=92696 RepID=A0A4R0RNE4_9APHY|nr:hypothetical protein EIP91_008482 [Steccherinum ochraceum]
MVKATEKRIFLTRHAQAEHNVDLDYSMTKIYLRIDILVHDAPLTQLGRQQSARLNEDTKNNIQQTAELLVSSPLRRTMSTTLVGYPDLFKRLIAQHKVILRPELQECNAHPCDVGSPRETLEADPEYGGKGLDFSTLTPDWTSKQGKYAVTVAALQERARENRKWLRERPEQEIVVVAHGDLLRYVTDGYSSDSEWANTEVREYTFEVDEDKDTDKEARLVLVRRVVKEGEVEPTSSGFKN